MTTNAVQAPSVKSAATAASIIHTRDESVSASGDESRGVRVRRTEGIVAPLYVYVRVCCLCAYAHNTTR